MSFLQNTIEDFVGKVDSKSPTPGGGSVSALSALLGISLARMMGHVTIGRKAFLRLEEEYQQDFLEAFEQLGILQEHVTPLIDEDSKAFNAIMEAYRLPKETSDEKKARNHAIEQATIGAIEVPLAIAECANEALALLPPILAYGNKNAASDVKVAALELHTAILGAVLNIEINLSGLSDPTLVTSFQEEANKLRKSANELVQKIQAY